MSTDAAETIAARSAKSTLANGPSSRFAAWADALRLIDPSPSMTRAAQKRGCSSGLGVGPSRCRRTAIAMASAIATLPPRAVRKVSMIRSRASALSIGQSAAIIDGTPAMAKDVDRPWMPLSMMEGS